MSTGYKISESEGLYYLTLQVVDWIDVFTRKEYKDILIDNLKYCQKHKGLVLFGYVIMSNHVHMLAQSTIGDLSGWLRDFKSYTGKLIIDAIHDEKESRKEWLLKLFQNAAAKSSVNKNFKFWTHENHAEHIYSTKFMRQKLEYIHDNPVKAGIVEKPEDYLYSSARNYAELPSLLDIEQLVLPVLTHTVKTGGWLNR
jgi:REP element-mobilizing transposase RayT